VGVASELVLYAGCLAGTPFPKYVACAAESGFDAVTVWPLMYRRAISREGLDPATMRRIFINEGPFAIAALGDDEHHATRLSNL